MSEANNEETTKMLGGVTGKGFMPGVSGNPNGRPKNTMKDYISRKFREMNDEQKEQWLKDNKITGIDMWKMGEGNPETKTDITSAGQPIIQVAEAIVKKQSDTSPLTE